MTMRTTHTAPANLRAWRSSHRLTQNAAARLLGVTQSYYSKIEKKTCAPRPQIAKRITEKTGVPLASILGIAS